MTKHEKFKDFLWSVHIMADLETMSTAPNAAIAQLGAVAYRPGDDPGVFLREFTINVDLVDCVRLGLHMDPSTVMWWFKQSREAQEDVLLAPSVSLSQALHQFRNFYFDENLQGTRIWGHGATFDPVIIKSAFEVAKMPCAFNFRDARDTRTIYDIVGGGDWSNMPDFGPKHSGLADAKRQVVVLQRAVAAMFGEE